jgi:SOS response regulatory protein OraA/RecX
MSTTRRETARLRRRLQWPRRSQAPEITALEEHAGRVHVDLDGRFWRSVPVDVAARVGLAVGRRLDRALARDLARALRRHQALGVAARALRTRDRSTSELATRLARASVPATARDEALEALARSGVVDDRRFASNRAAALAARGWGDAAIRARLEEAGVGEEASAEALASLEPERDRAATILERRGATTKTLRALISRGFDTDLVSELVGVVAAEG